MSLVLSVPQLIAYRNLEREIQHKAAKKLEEMEKLNPELFKSPVNVCSLAAHVERALWRDAVLDLIAKDTEVTQELMRIAGEI